VTKKTISEQRLTSESTRTWYSSSHKSRSPPHVLHVHHQTSPQKSLLALQLLLVPKHHSLYDTFITNCVTTASASDSVSAHNRYLNLHHADPLSAGPQHIRNLSCKLAHCLIHHAFCINFANVIWCEPRRGKGDCNKPTNIMITTTLSLGWDRRWR